jgi:hypothetical protein
MHRRPPLTAAPPPELLRFDPSEWPAEQWWRSLELWGQARMRWVKQHPGTAVGSALDVLRVQHRMHAEHRRAEWEASLGGRAS